MREEAPITASKRLFAPLALLGGVFAILVTLWMAYRDDWHVTRGIETNEAIAHMRNIAGPDAIACGDIAKDVMVECVRATLAGSRPFWAVYYQREENYHGVRWGFLRDPKGRLLLANHDNHRVLYYSHCLRMFVSEGPDAIPKCQLEERPDLVLPYR